jgi:hypothetical protein
VKYVGVCEGILLQRRVEEEDEKDEESEGKDSEVVCVEI